MNISWQKWLLIIVVKTMCSCPSWTVSASGTLMTAVFPFPNYSLPTVLRCEEPKRTPLSQLTMSCSPTCRFCYYRTSFCSSTEVIPKSFSALKSFGYSLGNRKNIETPFPRLPVRAGGSDPAIKWQRSPQAECRHAAQSIILTSRKAAKSIS